MIGLKWLPIDKIPVHAINANFKRYKNGRLIPSLEKMALKSN
jgi:hypothetical protein